MTEASGGKQANLQVCVSGITHCRLLGGAGVSRASIQDGLPGG